MSGKVIKTLKTVGIVAGGTGIAIGAVHGITNLLMDLALNREVPKLAKGAGTLVSGRKENSEFIQKLKEKSAELEKQDNEEIHIEAYDGVPLVGHWIPADNPKRILIAMHGWRSSWHGDFGMVAEAWKKNNCSVLYAEQRGQNNSGGDYIGFGLTERYDCESWVKWAVSEFGDSLPIYLVGVSMGATTVLYASGLDLPSEVHGIIADCGFTSPSAILKHVAEDNLHIPYYTKKFFVEDAFKKKIKQSAGDYSTIEALRENNIPVLFIHGTDDQFVPVAMTYENYKACAGPKYLVIVPGAGHGMSYFIDKESYEKAVLEFWEKYDEY